jgi:hypothetical protein
MPMALCAFCTSGCAEMIGSMIEPRTKAEAELALRCGSAPIPPFSEGEPAGFAAYQEARAHQGDVAVLVARHLWGTNTHDGLVWTEVFVAAVDGVKEVWPVEKAVGSAVPQQLPMPCDGRPSCYRLAVRPGRHELTVSGVMRGEEVKARRISGRIAFAAEAGSLYSLHVCRSDASKKPLFWIRHEESATCVSETCP